jgi:hypothetical protein
VADPTDERAARSLRKAGERRIAHGALGTAHANLDQFVIVQGPRRLGDHGLGEAGVADQDDGFEGVGEALEVATLFVGDFHGADCSRNRSPQRPAGHRVANLPPSAVVEFRARIV